MVFLSHCLLNENTRYLGGAARRCCVREVIERCMDQGIGMIQMPCPEQEVWGGVSKKWMLRLYGPNRGGRFLPVLLAYVRMRYRWIARRVARQIQDYLASGYEVVGIVGIDGSPSCGVRLTLNIREFVGGISRIDAAGISRDEENELVRRNAIAGRGLFIEELQRELKRRNIEVPFQAHDLFAELDGRPSKVMIDGA